MGYFEMAPEVQEGWKEQPNVAIPFLHRDARAFRRARFRWFNRLMHVLTANLKLVHDVVEENTLWTDTLFSDFLFLVESTQEQPCQTGLARDLACVKFRKSPGKHECVYWTAIARHTQGLVRLKVTSPSSSAGGVVFSVGIAENLNGPWTTYTAPTVFQFNPQLPQPQEFDIPLGSEDSLTVGKQYFYRLAREYAHSGDTLNAVVGVSGVRTR